MKYILSVLLIVNIAFSFDDTSFLKRDTVYSQNKKYCGIISGMYNEGYSGASYTLYDLENQDTVWSQFVEGDQLFPCVSNIGDMTISAGSELKIYDTDEHLKGVNTGDQIYSYGGPTVQAFSLSGDRLCFFAKNNYDSMDDVTLICVTNSAVELWRDSIGLYRPTNLIFYKDKYILHYSNFHSSPPYRCFILDMEGAVVWQYDRKTKGEWDVQFDDKSGLLIIVDGLMSKKIDINTIAAP
jgi:hypothetical protein